MYDIVPDLEAQETVKEAEDDGKNFTFEEYTETYDKNNRKVEDDGN